MDSTSALRITDLRTSGNDVLLSFQAVAGRACQVESRDSLSDPNLAWTVRSSFTNGSDAVVQVLDAGALNVALKRFYRVKCGPNGEVVTDPVGWYRVALIPGANAISVPMQPLATARGLVTSVNGQTVTLNGNPGWSANVLASTNGFSQHQFMVRKHVNSSPGVEGDWWTVVGNTSSSVTLNTGVDDLATLLAAGDQVEIRHLTSIQDLFGSGARLLVNQDHDGSASTGDSSKADVILPIGSSNLKESGWHLDRNGAAASGDSSQSDVIRPITGTSFDSPIFYHDGTLAPAGWYNGSTLDNNYALQPGRAYIFFISGTSPVRWRQTVP